MDWTGISDEYLLYGYLFSLTNRIQTLGDGEFGDVTMKQHFLLICVSIFKEPPSLRETASLMGCSYQNVKRMAAALEEKGYLLIETDKKDHRRQRLVLTDRTWRFREKYRENEKAFMKKVYKDLAPEEIRITVQTVRRMNENLDGPRL